MKLTPESRHRHSIRLKGYDYSQAGGYYVTIVSYQREPLFGEILNGEVQINPLGTIVQDCWLEIPTHFPHVALDAFVVMPNHIHGVLFIHNVNVVGARHVSPLQKRHVSPLQKGYTPPSHPPQSLSYPRGFKPGSVGAMIASFKSSVTRIASKELNSGNIWQRNYFEHIIRDQKDYTRIAAYIFENPHAWEQDEENLKNHTG